jgi:hypothetical protein
MIHRIEIANTAAEYKSHIEQLQLEQWRIEMVQFLQAYNQWVITAVSEEDRPKLEYRKDPA